MRSTSKSSTRTHPPKVVASAAQPPAPVQTRRQSIRRYEALMQLVPDALVVVESTGRIRLVNRKAEELFGYSAGELLGQPVELLVPEQLQPVLRPPDYAEAPSLYPGATNLPLSGRRRDGTEFPIEARLARLDEGGEALVMVSIHDISAYQWVHDAQVAAQLANQNLYALQALTDTALSHLSLDDLLPALLERVTEVLDVDNAAVLLLDSAEKTLTVYAAHGFDEVATAQVPVPVGQGFAGRIAQTRKPLVVDDIAGFPFVNPLPREQFHSMAGVPLVLGDQLLGVVHVGTVQPRHFTTSDAQVLKRVADRMALSIDRARLYAKEQQARKKLAERVAELEAIMEAVPDALTVYDAAGHVRLANAAHHAQVARFMPPTPPRRTVKQSYRHIGGAHAASAVQLGEGEWPLTRALRGEVLTGANAVELAARTPQDEMAIFSVTGAPLRDADGRITGAVTVSRDITEQKRLALEREELRAHEVALEETARHMDEFLATASHDLRSPLTVVRTRMQIALRRLTRLQEGAAASALTLPEMNIEALHASLQAANHSADRLTRLVNLLFDVARARSGTLELQLVPCDLSALVREQMTVQRLAAPDRTIELVAPSDPEFVWVWADADRLAQVLTNYLANALKYSPADRPVTVRLEVVEDQAVASVIDHGPGLPVEEQSRIWEWFHRAPGIAVQYESAQASGSLGLGLHICKKVIELHPGGSVGVDSEVGTGSTFWFRLPLAS